MLTTRPRHSPSLTDKVRKHYVTFFFCLSLAVLFLLYLSLFVVVRSVFRISFFCFFFLSLFFFFFRISLSLTPSLSSSSTTSSSLSFSSFTLCCSYFSSSSLSFSPTVFPNSYFVLSSLSILVLLFLNPFRGAHLYHCLVRLLTYVE